jgi:5-methyltetrahydrofolate--homocysteine methyltransferase
VRTVDDVTIDDLVPHIDWRFFFTAWEMGGNFPAILDHPEKGAAARDLYEAANQMLGRIAREKLLTARGTYGFWPAASDGNDLVLFTDAARRVELARLPMLRQQVSRTDDDPFYCLSDFVAPAGGVPDHVGAFAVTAGLGADELVAKFERAHDDYSAILVKSLADRLAEAFAELLHARARRAWTSPSEALSAEELRAERYRGIRPAFGYPACPDLSVKATAFELLGARSIGMALTESFAMTPAASVCGLYLGHPEARYFTVGRIDRDQVEDYARRRGLSVEQVESWLRSNLGYE